jgi:hypothetical protein
MKLLWVQAPQTREPSWEGIGGMEVKLHSFLISRDGYCELLALRFDRSIPAESAPCIPCAGRPVGSSRQNSLHTCSSVVRPEVRCSTSYATSAVLCWDGHLFVHGLHAWNRILLDKLTSRSRNLLYWTWRVVTVFTDAFNWTRLEPDESSSVT